MARTGKFLLPLAIALVVVLLLGACAKSSSTPTPQGQTLGQYAQPGETVFANRCAKCHGDNGQGVTAPAVIGSNANLQKYDTAQGLLNYIKVAMPQDAPGSLTSQEYLQVVAFLLLQNNFGSAQTTFDPAHLDSFQLAK